MLVGAPFLIVVAIAIGGCGAHTKVTATQRCSPGDVAKPNAGDHTALLGAYAEDFVLHSRLR